MPELVTRHLREPPLVTPTAFRFINRISRVVGGIGGFLIHYACLYSRAERYLYTILESKMFHSKLL